jgi:Fe-S cluster assembly scaffold protein SufB
VTEATAEAAAAPPSTPPLRPRRPRRAPGDLTFELDEALVERFAATEPDWLAADRRAALDRYRTVPVEPNQLYTTYLDLRLADLGSVRPYGETASRPASSGATLPDGAGGLADFREDDLVALELGSEARAAGVVLTTLAGLVASDPEGARRLLIDGAKLPDDDRLAQLTRASWNQGLVIRVPDGVTLERPIVVRWAAGVPDRAIISRTIIELGAGARASVLEELVPSGPRVECAAGEPVPQSLFTGTLEVIVGANAELRLGSIQEFGPGVVAFQHRTARIGDGAKLHWALGQVGGRLVRSRVDNRLEGDRSSVEQVEIVFGAEEQLFDLTSYTWHVGRNTTGNLLSKGALLEASKSFMKGLITIEKTAIGTDSFLGEFGMNLSKKARAVAIPSLEIDQPDCRRAAHSSSVGPIDESQVFYLASRGIALDEARKIIVFGFLEPVVARVPLESARDRLRELLETKWNESAVPESASAA